MDNNLFSEYEELIGEIARKYAINYMKENNVVKLFYGKIIGISGNRYKVDIGDTVISDILNKSGHELKIGDTVALIDNIESNYSGCFIAYKNG